MADEYTPTAGSIKDAYFHVQQEVFGERGDSAHERFHAEFDRWLEAHDGEVVAKALEEAAESLTVKTVDPAYEGQQNDGEFGSGFYQGIRSSRRALRARAAGLRGQS